MILKDYSISLSNKEEKMNSISKFCSECGAPLEEDARFCGECGATVTDLPDSNESKLEQEKIESSPREAEKKDFNPPPPKLEKKNRQDNSTTHSEDSSFSNNHKWLIPLIILFIILAGGGAVYVYMEQQNQDSSYNRSLYKQKSDLSATTSGSNSKKQRASYIRITKQMLINRVLYSKDFDGYLEISFLAPSYKPFDGNIVFTSLQNRNSVVGDKEALGYELKDGQMIYYSNSGSKYRITLISATPDSWVILEEEDGDGDDKRLGYAQPVKKFYYLKKPKDYPRLEDCKPFSDCQCSMAPF